jgi:thioredoxin-related protein
MLRNSLLNITRIAIRFLPVLFLLPFTGVAQDKGMQFEHQLSWAAIQAKAKAENKYIFMDCFTTWCGPCRFMSTTIFPQETAGNFFNDKFVNLQVQLDTTAKDNVQVKSWYADAHAIMTQYGVQAFPTYLIFAPDGRILHRMVGSRLTAQDFITDVQAAFDTTKQFYTQLQQFQRGRGDSSFLRRLAGQSLDVYDMKDGAPVAKAWFATQASLYTPEAMNLLERYTQTSKDPGFAIFLQNPEKANTILGAGKAQRLVIDILLNEYVRPKLNTGGAFGPDWKDIGRAIAAKYPAQAPEVTARGKVMYYESKQDWPHFQSEIVAYMQQYGGHATNDELNSYAWTVFQKCADMTCVSDALDWSKRSFKDQPNAAFMDTYANILYKMGKKDDAIAWEQKALELADGGDKLTYQGTIDKMKKGVKTWD